MHRNEKQDAVRAPSWAESSLLGTLSRADLLANLDESLHAVVGGFGQIRIELDAVPWEDADARAAAVLEVAQLFALLNAISRLLAPHNRPDQHGAYRHESSACVSEAWAEVGIDHHHAALVLREDVQICELVDADASAYFH